MHGGFASLGEDESRWLIEHHPEQVISAANPLLHHVPALAVPILLERAVGDHRELHSHPEHALVFSRIGYAAPRGTGEVIRRRGTVVRTAIDWLNAGRVVEVGVGALALSMSPRSESTKRIQAAAWSSRIRTASLRGKR